MWTFCAWCINIAVYNKKNGQGGAGGGDDDGGNNCGGAYSGGVNTGVWWLRL